MKLSTTVKTKKGYVWIDTCFTMDKGLETMVFKSNKNGKVSDWMDLDCERYFSDVQAKEGHKEMVKKWKNN
jgi:hypothetical protein